MQQNRSIEPTKIVAKIQSTNANPIIENNLKEGKAVKENSLLLKYNGTPEQTQLSELLNQKKQVLDKKAQLDILQRSLTNEKMNFPLPIVLAMRKVLKTMRHK